MKKRFLMSIVLCVILCMTTLAANLSVSVQSDGNSVVMTAQELTPGYYFGAIWKGDELLTLFDTKIGSNGVLNQTVEVGLTLQKNDRLTIGISGQNVGTTSIMQTVIVPSIGNSSGSNDGSSSGGSISNGSTTTTTDRTYDVRVPSTSGGTVTVSPKNAKKGETVTLTITPNDGYELDTLTVTSAANKDVDVTVNGSTATFTMPSATVTIKATFKKLADDTVTTPDNTPHSGFEDVPDTSAFSYSVAWAVENDITEGYEDGTFGPAITCTNNHILTFLWRSQGSPDAEGETDFEKAINWAIENGIADADVDGEASCTRADAVMYLWRLAGSPETDGASFLDVDADAEYADAVAWALSQGITTGVTPDYFEPDTICNRGQIVTFLYRAYA